MSTEAPIQSRLLNQRQACELLGISPRTFRKLVAAGTLAPVRISGLGRVRFRRSDVEELIENGRAP